MIDYENRYVNRDWSAIKANVYRHIGIKDTKIREYIDKFLDIYEGNGFKSIEEIKSHLSFLSTQSYTPPPWFSSLFS